MHHPFRLAAPALGHLVATGLIAGTLVAPASAQEQEALLGRLSAAMTEQGTSMEWENVETTRNGAGDEVVVLTGVTFSAGDAPIDIGTLELVGPQEADDTITLKEIVMPGWEHTDDDMDVAVTDVRLQGVVLSPEGEQNAYGSALIYDAARMGGLTVAVKGEDMLSVSDASMVLDVADGGSMSFEGSVDSFTAWPEKADNPTIRAAATAMGYGTINGDVAFAGNWDPASGQLALSQYDITVEEAGTLGISIDLGGYTVAFLESMREVQQQMIASDDGDDSAQGLAVLSLLMQQINFGSAQIRFEDDSFTGRLLDHVATQQGQSREAVVAQLKSQLPMGLLLLNNQDLSRSITEAVNAFLDDPRNLTIRAQPAQPVPFAVIGAGVLGAPHMLLQQLGLSVSANE